MGALRRGRLGILTLGVAAALVACSDPSPMDFSDEAEQFLRSDLMFTTYGLDLPEPDCTVPSEVETGAFISCAATAADGTNYGFNFEITSGTGLVLQSIEFTD